MKENKYLLSVKVGDETRVVSFSSMELAIEFQKLVLKELPHCKTTIGVKDDLKRKSEYH